MGPKIDPVEQPKVYLEVTKFLAYLSFLFSFIEIGKK